MNTYVSTHKHLSSGILFLLTSSCTSTYSSSFVFREVDTLLYLVLLVSVLRRDLDLLSVVIQSRLPFLLHSTRQKWFLHSLKLVTDGVERSQGRESGVMRVQQL